MSGSCSYTIAAACGWSWLGAATLIPGDTCDLHLHMQGTTSAMAIVLMSDQTMTSDSQACSHCMPVVCNASSLDQQRVWLGACHGSGLHHAVLCPSYRSLDTYPSRHGCDTCKWLLLPMHCIYLTLTEAGRTWGRLGLPPATAVGRLHGTCARMAAVSRAAAAQAPGTRCTPPLSAGGTLLEAITFGRCGLDIQQYTPCSVFTCPVHSIGATSVCEADEMTSKTIWAAFYDARVDKQHSCTAKCIAGSPSNFRLPRGLVAAPPLHADDVLGPCLICNWEAEGL